MGPAVYLDYNASTPVDPRVIAKMLPFFSEHYGNPSSAGHAFGWAASAAVGAARLQVSRVLGAKPSEVVFTSGASEGISMAIKGLAQAYRGRGRHLVTVQTEHAATLSCCRQMEQQGFRVTYLPVNRDGRVEMDVLEAALTDDTILVSIMWANNETGVVQPIQGIASCVRDRGILLMTDATQAVGKLPVHVDDVDVLVCSGHKMYGPKGVGVLYVRRRVRVPALVAGGGQERGMRGGTLNVPGIVGIGEAMELASQDLDHETKRQRELRDTLESMLQDALPEVCFNGSAVERLPNTSSVMLPEYTQSDLLGQVLNGVAVSAGSACASGMAGASHVLQAMGITPEQAARTLRISLGRPTRGADVERAAKAIAEAARPAMLTC